MITWGKHRSTSVTSVPFIYASIIAPVPTLIANHGGKIEPPFREAGVPVELAGRPETIIPILGYLRLLEAAARETGDRNIGLSMAECLRLEDLGPFGRLITGAASLGEAIETTCRTAQRFSSAVSSWLTFEGATACWHYDLACGRGRREGRRLDCEQYLVMYRTLVRSAAGPDWQPDEIWVESGSSDELRVLRTRLGVDVRAGGGGYAIGFPRHLLDLPMTGGTPLTAIERLRLRDQLLSTKPEESFLGSIEAVVGGQLSAGYPDIGTVARSLGLGVRTLQRRLGDEGVVYSDVVDNVRLKLALALLADPSNSQLDTALAIGYCEASSFSRSFKRWTGRTPREYRGDFSVGAGLQRSPKRIAAVL